MYIPKYFKVTNVDEIWDFVQTNSFGTIVTTEQGEVFTWGRCVVEGVSILGNGSSLEDPDAVQHHPKKLSTLRHNFVTSVSLGCSHALCLTRDGLVFSVSSPAS